MKFSWLSIICALLFSIATCLADDIDQLNPEISGFLVAPTRTDQCNPVRFMFTLTDKTKSTVSSQQPYSGTTYNMYRTFGDGGFSVLPDAYMVAVSLNGGKDGYPYRWGFQGALLPSKTTTIVGYLALVEVGNYEITAALLKGGALADPASIRKATVRVDACSPAEPTEEPVPVEPVYPYINGVPESPYVAPLVLGGHLLVPARSFAYSIGTNVYVLRRSIVLSRPGVDLVLFPGRRRAVLNGLPIYLPVPPYSYGGITYIPPRFVSPLMGQTVYWNPYSRMLFVQGP